MAWSLTTPATEDLDGIWWYIAQQDSKAADKMIERLVSRFDMLARQPHIGEKCEELGMRLRNFPVRPYVIYYIVEVDSVSIIRVLHGARDVRTLF